jgi:penicillin-binding protein 2
LFEDLKEMILSVVKSRLFVLFIIFIILPIILIQRLFYLQIIKGEEYLDGFELKITKEKILPSTRGNIYDRNGELLAYNELAPSVTMEDNYDSSNTKNAKMNDTIYRLIKIIEDNHDSVIHDFNIVLENGEFAFAVEGTSKLRFLADIYGYRTIEELEEEEKNATPDQVMEFLCGEKKFGIGTYEDPENRKNFQIGKPYTKEEQLKLVTIRYAMSLNAFQKYIPTTIATNVSEETVAIIEENKTELQGADISNDTLRYYVDSKYFSHILGYTGKVSQEELDALLLEREDYRLTDMVGKAGIEKVMETKLQGKKGFVTIFVDNVGKIVDTLAGEEPSAGNDLYLTIDKNLQKASYNLLEQKLAGVLLDHIENIKEYDPTSGSASRIKIPIDDVYFALIKNSVLKISHFEEEDAKTYEKQVYQSFLSKQESVLSQLEAELLTTNTPYKELSKEMQVYESYIASRSMLASDSLGILMRSEIDTTDPVYNSWREETIGLKEYLEYSIKMNWIDITKFQLEEKYSDSSEVYNQLVQFILQYLRTDAAFSKYLYQYMIKNNQLSGREICLLLFEQNILEYDEEAIAQLESGSLSPYSFIRSKIQNLEITPAQLALDPCTGSCVVTDAKTGEILACVSYPSYDNNRMANNADAEYFSSLRTDLSNPLYNYATQQRTAPGSTFKIVSSIAGLEEGVISLGEAISCEGEYDKVSPAPKCWIAPGRHGALDLSKAIQKSCNYFFYELGYRLSTDVTGKYDSDLGLGRLAKYAEMFGLGDYSGIEIEESKSTLSTEVSILSTIGQSNHNFTTVSLARYINAVANSGTVYNLSLLDKLTDSNGNVIEDYSPKIRNKIELNPSIWDAVHEGMRGMIMDSKTFTSLNTAVAGKTGTAEESKVRGNHGLFVGYGPYDNPQIAVAARIANGYSSSNAAELTRDIFQYYFQEVSEDKLITGKASLPYSSIAGD